jgi:hypothetical protein
LPKGGKAGGEFELIHDFIHYFATLVTPVYGCLNLPARQTINEEEKYGEFCLF